jgi:putative endonuclease
VKLSQLFQSKARTEERKTGDAFEDRALAFLEQQGLTPVTRNWQTPSGEIDLVMREDSTLVFVEVRKRKDASFGGALASIDHTKQSKLVRTVDVYLSRLPTRPAYRIDAVTFDRDDRPVWTQNILA